MSVTIYINVLRYNMKEGGVTMQYRPVLIMGRWPGASTHVATHVSGIPPSFVYYNYVLQTTAHQKAIRILW